MMNGKREIKIFAAVLVVFGICHFLPIESERFRGAVLESMALVKWYAREHVILCLVPAFFIAGAIGVFLSQGAVMKYLGAGANRILAYAVASVSGSILAVCSCTVLPLFAGIYARGAGLGPATAFLYSGPAINILAIILTARVLGFQIGLARAVGAIIFAVLIGLMMQFLFRRGETEREEGASILPEDSPTRSLWQTVAQFALMIATLVFATWQHPGTETGAWFAIWAIKWPLTGAAAGALAVTLVLWFGLRAWLMCIAAIPVAAAALLVPSQPLLAFVIGIAGLSIALGVTPGEPRDWLMETWSFAKKILPLLLAGVLAAGFFLGAPDLTGEGAGQGIIPSEWIANLVGGNSIMANLFASVVGALMYFATLTEVPILEGLLAAGMGKGPALALLLAGPALSLPNVIVIHSIMGLKKTATFVALVVVMSTVAGIVFGLIAG